MSLLSLRCVMNRSCPSFMNTSAALAIRGPKKKGGKKNEVQLPDNPDIVNIFKDGKDAPVYPSDMYPPYVMQLLDKQYSPDEVML